MTDPILQIFGSSRVNVPGSPDNGTKNSSSLGATGSQGDTVFSQVFTSQQRQLQGELTSTAALSVAVLPFDPVLEHEGVQDGGTSPNPTHSALESLLFVQHVNDPPVNVGSGKIESGDARLKDSENVSRTGGHRGQALLQAFQVGAAPHVSSTGQTLQTSQTSLGSAVSLSLGSGPPVSETLPANDGLRKTLGHLRQPLTGLPPNQLPGEIPLVRSPLNVNGLPSGVPTTTTVYDPGLLSSDAASIQRVATTFSDATLYQELTQVTVAARNGLTGVKEEVLPNFSRLQGEVKTLSSLGIAPSSEALSGGAASDLPFGNSTGSAFGQPTEFQQGSVPTISQSQVSLRTGSFDERLQLLNTSVPQRLQIDVQLSEASRVQVDIGVQQRQVYAGLFMDSPVLRTLALQNIQELETQLGQADMELEEFDVLVDHESQEGQNANRWLEGTDAEFATHGHTGGESGDHARNEFVQIIERDAGLHLLA